jgi:hypothetical protein
MRENLIQRAAELGAQLNDAIASGDTARAYTLGFELQSVHDAIRRNPALALMLAGLS